MSFLSNYFLSNCKTYKINFTDFNSEEKYEYIENIFKKTSKLEHHLLEAVIALFTLENLKNIQ